MLKDPEALADAVLDDIEQKNKQLTTIHRLDPIDAKSIAAEYANFGKMLAPFVSDTSRFLEEKLKQGKSVLAEGAQGTLLDLDHGTYPFVTSSWPTSGGALIGLGVGPKHVDRVVGVGKAFTSRVGSGPFPSELDGDEAVRLRGTGDQPWDEFGTTTGRPRRVGWLDTVILRYAARINGLTELALTKLDILSGIPDLPVCVSYEFDGEELRHFPSDLTVLAKCKPIYKRLPGWMDDITQVRRMADLPKEARMYVDFVSQEIGVPISLVSIGPGREQIIQA
jgi:adenylosuccinate synthase